MGNRIFTEADCEETGTGCSLKGKVVVLHHPKFRIKARTSFIIVRVEAGPVSMHREEPYLW